MEEIKEKMDAVVFVVVQSEPKGTRLVITSAANVNLLSYSVPFCYLVLRPESDKMTNNVEIKAFPVVYGQNVYRDLRWVMNRGTI